MKKIEIIGLIASVIMLITSILLFIIFKDSNKFIHYLAGFLLIAAAGFLGWAEFFINVKPLKLSIILSVIDVGISLLSLYIFKFLQKDSFGAPIAISVSYMVANYLNKNLESIEKVFNKYFSK